MRKFKINAASISPSRYEHEVDEEFLQEVSSIITLEDGSSINLEKAVLLYNPDSRQIQLSDSDVIPNNFVQLATLVLTSPKPKVTPDESFEEPTEEGTEETPSEESTETDDDSGEFFT